MRYLSSVSVAAGLFCCLAASPARADLATPEAGGADAPSGQVFAALQALSVVIDAASTVSGSSALASETKSTGPSSAPATSKGVDSSSGPAPTGAIVATSSGSFGLFAAAATSNGETAQAAPPAGLPQGGIQVASASLLSTDLTSVAPSGSSPLIAPNDTVVTPTPIPAAFLLLGGGLVGIFPLRRSSRLSLGA